MVQDRAIVTTVDQ